MICVLAGGKTTVFAAATFTLSWTHSIERTHWQETWSATPAGLQLTAARVKGSGAGMEPGEDAVLKDGWWVWRPRLPPQEKLRLAASGATGEGWMLCAEGRCTLIGDRPATACDVHR
jgi:hypothetical protein